MGSCTRRHFLLSTCFLQMVTIIERQVFDFLGYMWAPICVNFFHIIFVIFGFYGAYHFRIKYIITYLIWSFLWVGWNSFLICFYLNVGVLDRDSDLLNLGTGSVSWFEVNGYGCKPTYPTNLTIDDPYRPIRPERVDDCLLDYTTVEIIHSGVQCGLAFFGILAAILMSYLFLDEDDRFDFMNGDAKSPQHTVVHPMYVSYTSIPTSASATMLSHKQHHHQHQQQQQQQQRPQQLHVNHHNQQQAYNNNTFLIHAANRSNSNLSLSLSSTKMPIAGNMFSNNGINAPSLSKTNTLTRMLYSPKNNKIASSTTSILSATSSATPTPNAYAHKHAPPQQQLKYYDDSTAKADQMFTNSNRRQLILPTYQPQHVATPGSSHGNTTSSLSYASLQNSNFNLRSATPLTNSNYSLNNNTTNNNSNLGSPVGSRFARIHPKPKPPKSTSYSSFINTAGTAGSVTNPLHRPDIKYTQIGGERLSQNFEEGFEDDDFSMANFKGDDTVTYVPFQKPTPGQSLYVGQNNNPSYASLNSYASTTQNVLNNNSNNHSHNSSSNNNNSSPSGNGNGNHNNNNGLYVRDTLGACHGNGNEILLENGAVLHPAPSPLSQPILSPADRFLYQQNGLPFHPAYSPTPFRASSAQPPPARPTNIPLPIHMPAHSLDSPISPSEGIPPPPPAPRPHIFQPRSGHAPYPDLSPEVTERYAMPTQYVPRSPVVSRIARRQRQQQQHQHDHQPRTQNVNPLANFCDQVRDAPPGYIDTGFSIVRAHSHDRLSSVNSTSGSMRESKGGRAEAAPHVNRRSGRREGKTRPRSYCNSIVGGEGVVRGNFAHDRGGGVANEVSGFDNVA